MIVDTEDFTSVTLAAQKLGCSRAYIYELFKQNTIVPLDIYGMKYVWVKDLDIIQHLLATANERRGKRSKN